MWRRLTKNRAALLGLACVILLYAGAIFAPMLAQYPPNEQHHLEILKGPSAEHLLGTDALGRDILSRSLFGARVSLTISFIGMAISMLFGVAIGTLSGYFSGSVDSVLQRLVDTMMAFPALILAIAIVAAIGPTLTGMVIAVGVAAMPAYARLTRSVILSLKERDFIAAAKSSGAGHFRVMLVHLVPNSLGPIVVQTTLGFGGAILLEAGLSFLGLGVQPPTPSWGRMIADGREYIYSAPHLITIPGLFIMLTVLSFNLLGDGLRDAIDPRFYGP